MCTAIFPTKANLQPFKKQKIKLNEVFSEFFHLLENLNVTKSTYLSNEKNQTPIRNESDKSISKHFTNEKFMKQVYFFTCILPDYVSHESSKGF